MCILVHVAMGERPALSAACSPDGEDGVCLAEVTVPASWWPPLPPPDPSGRPIKPVKTPQRTVKASPNNYIRFFKLFNILRHIFVSFVFYDTIICLYFYQRTHFILGLQPKLSLLSKKSISLHVLQWDAIWNKILVLVVLNILGGEGSQSPY